ncbi:uncharacterized protein PAC_06684 [Phialocephala subalpina]|uniref:Uncharacterized protein n=1 Tax=Phialocephala subalpina TaxID=576137 RepID=A0A1L7WVK4_9HELO|nr:uncharacterized protein PAC_06684 [Phialocephala subalpina]
MRGGQISLPVTAEPAAPSSRFCFITNGDDVSRKRIRSHAMSVVRQQQRDRKRVLLEQRQQLNALNPTRGICTCRFEIPESSETEAKLMSRHEWKKQLHADSYKTCLQCRGLRFLELSRAGQLEVLRRIAPQVVPFVESEFDPFHTNPELPIKLGASDYRELNEIKAHLITYYSPGAIRAVTIPTAMASPGLFMSMLYLGAAYLYARYERPESSLALLLKSEAIKWINIKMKDQEQAVAPENIAAIAYLSTGTRNFGAISALDEVEAHEAGIEALVKQRAGGLEGLNATPFGQALRGILIMHHIVNAAITASKPSPVFDLGDDHVLDVLGDSEYVPESPLCKPRKEFFSLRRSKHCSAKTLELIERLNKLFHNMIASKGENDVSQDYLEEADGIYQPLMTPSESPRLDYYFESCRLTALIMLNALRCHQPLAKVTSRTMTALLVETLKYTDVPGNWSDMGGVLYWISLVGLSAAFEKPEHPFFDSTMGRMQFELCYMTKDHRASIRPAQMFARVHEKIKE